MFTTNAAIVALALFLGANSAWAECTKSECLSCDTLSVCNAGTPTESQCSGGMVCLELYGAAFCGIKEDSECFDCSSGPFRCDPYNSSNIIACREGDTPVTVEECPGGCQDGACIVGEPGQTPEEICANITDGISTNKPFCTSVIVCSGGAPVNIQNSECPAGQYFNFDVNKCRSPPIDNCEGKPDGLFPYLTDCTKGVVCVEGEQVYDIQCDPGVFFDGNSCNPSATGENCPANDGCSEIPTEDSDGVVEVPDTSTSTTTTTTSSTTTTTTSTPSDSDDSTTSTTTTPAPTRPSSCNSSNVTQRYPHETDCKKYYTCRRISTNSYQYVLSTCSGSLLFNPTTSYCDLPANVSRC